MLVRLEQAIPRDAADCTPARAQQFRELSISIEAWGDEIVFRGSPASAADVMKVVKDLLTAKRRVDAALEKTFATRTVFAEIQDEAAQRAAARTYLEISSCLIDLSGRLRYLQNDAIHGASYYVATDEASRLELLGLLTEFRSSIGAAVMAGILASPSEEGAAKDAQERLQRKTLELFAVSDEPTLLPFVAAFVRTPEISPALLLGAVDAIKAIGLPQDLHPQQDKTCPPPVITAKELQSLLQKLEETKLDEKQKLHRAALLGWLEERLKHGVRGDSFRFAGHEVQAGDWLLMRNPSPYNLFTDLSPGLFTHVGVVTTDVDSQGIRRFVIVDLPERGETIPVGNVESYVQRTLHYVFVRHRDPRVAAKMGEAARDMIGNPTQFDLTFRTQRIADYKGKSLRGETLHTYCAGFLLLCSQFADRPREEFFPITEVTAPGRTAENLKTLGLSVGDDFVSPTGAIFSPSLQIVGTRQPMYDPSREIKELVYDHFARQLQAATLRESPSAAQAAREKLARLSQQNVWLKKALAQASGVSDRMDLLAAAKAAAVVETLDEVADASMFDYFAADEAFYAPAREMLSEEGYSEKKQQQIAALRTEHAELYAKWEKQELTPLDLRTALVKFYAARGKKQLDERFFPPAK